jgi:aspartyl-tRNA(Asn)/glutamyl-tRNA(Gln) amidotransferase subunit B
MRGSAVKDFERIVIGLEVHVQLKTDTKLFCRCPNEFGDQPNENTCPVCMGLPGSLPVLNETAVEFAVRAAKTLNCSVASQSKFDRKNYYYPDLPKAYQISQYDEPVAESGELTVEWEDQESTIEIERLHLEEDAGKLIHARTGDESYVDYNRAGTPLIEIVTGPVMSHPLEAVSYLETLKKRMEYIGVSDCNMEEGSLRCDANLSIRNDDDSLGVKTEVKNMNSFNAVQSALTYEASRQQRRLDRGETVKQGTRLWDEDQEETRSMRTKEEEHDYRYFPEPDLVPLTIDTETVDSIVKELPEMPDVRHERFREDYELSEEEATLLTSSRAMADYFEAAVDNGHTSTVVNLMISDLRRELNDRDWTIDDVDLSPENLFGLAQLLDEDVISSNVASELIEELVEDDQDPEILVEERGLKQISDENELSSIVNEVIEENSDAVEDFKNGKDQAIGYLMGQVMQKTQGQANPEQAKKLLRETITQG